MVKPGCDAPGCTGKHEARGWCRKHYMAARADDPSRPLCSIPGCPSREYSSGWCQRHYGRNYFYGGPEVSYHAEGFADALERYSEWRDNGCREWTAAVSGAGYGVVRFEGRNRPAHRIAFEFEYGPIHSDLVVNHKCWNPTCVNPEHLEAITHGENLAYRKGPNSNSTSGHRNVYWDSRKGKWYAQVSPGGVKKSGPVRVRLEDAVDDARRLRDLHFGNYAGNG